MSITKKEVEHLANLARLTLSDDEKARLTREMSNIIDFAQKLDETDYDSVKPTMHANAKTNVFREDEIKPSFKASEILQNAPQQDEGCFVVPRTVE
ncbi:MAG: Asp-tRNA(Asn)/Glu-tRNA(Gln) amidotransferase subunit GatC [Clostridia bacterium]|nr:Asp-tRNA(Asn)/Glu-tRNA(Gln) amidotransferase subunit GatC [Clostridia bacterium]